MADEKEDFQAKYIYLIDIDVIKGINLAKADTFGQSDGYVKVKCLNRQYKTVVQKKTLDPVWNAHTQFQFYEEPKTIDFIVQDWNAAGSSTPLGDYTLSLAGMFKPGAKPFSGCVTLENINRGEIEIKVVCKKLAPFEILAKVEKLEQQCQDERAQSDKCDTQIANCKDQCKTIQQQLPIEENRCKELEQEKEKYAKEERLCYQQGLRCDEEIETLGAECTNLESQYEKIKAEYGETKKELKTYKQEYKTKQERKHAYMDSQGVKDTDKLRIIGKIEGYAANLKKDDDDDDVDYDDTICQDIVVQYSRKRKEAKQYQANAAKYEDQNKTEECEEERRKFQKATDAAMKYLQDITQWNQRIMEELYRKKDKCLEELQYDDTNYSTFFTSFYMAICKFFFNTQIVAATIEEFAEEIKKETGKKASKCTFYDFAGLDDSTDDGDDEKSSLWNKIYGEIDFVVDELNKLFSDTVKKSPLLKLCSNARDFIRKYFKGNYPKFAYYVSWATCEIITDEENPIVANPNHLTDDALGSIVLLFTDNKNFPLKLFECMTKYTSFRCTDDPDDDDYCEDDAPMDAFETIIAQVIVSIAQLDCVGIDLLTDADKKKINKQRDCVLQKASELNIDAKSCKLIEDFFAYFFDPKGSSMCCDCDGGDEGGIMGFFGSIFGGMCK